MIVAEPPLYVPTALYESVGESPVSAATVQRVSSVSKFGFERRFAVAYDPVNVYGLYAKYSNLEILASN